VDAVLKDNAVDLMAISETQCQALAAAIHTALELAMVRLAVLVVVGALASKLDDNESVSEPFTLSEKPKTNNAALETALVGVAIEKGGAALASEDAALPLAIVRDDPLRVTSRPHSRLVELQETITSTKYKYVLPADGKGDLIIEEVANIAAAVGIDGDATAFSPSIVPLALVDIALMHKGTVTMLLRGVDQKGD